LQRELDELARADLAVADELSLPDEAGEREIGRHVS